LLLAMAAGQTPARFIDQFLSPDAIDTTGPVTEVQFLAQFDAYRFLQKMAMIVSRFRITSDELEILIARASALGWLRLNQLPLAALDTSSLFGPWEILAALFALRNRLPSVKPLLLEIIADAADNKDVIGKLAVHTGWDQNELKIVAAALGLHNRA